jgi:hypothetical protein
MLMVQKSETFYWGCTIVGFAVFFRAFGQAARRVGLCGVADYWYEPYGD